MNTTKEHHYHGMTQCELSKSNGNVVHTLMIKDVLDLIFSHVALRLELANGKWEFVIGSILDESELVGVNYA